MNFTLNDFLVAAQNPLTFILWFFIHGGWVFLVGGIFYSAAAVWLSWRRSLYDQKRRFLTLAIDVPRLNEQTLKAVEQMITHLSGAHDGPKKEDKWVSGRMDESFGLEIISIGGYIQFVIHTNAKFRDLVEAAIYSQYPDAEINVVEDYTKPFKGMKFPNKEWDLWGTEMILNQNQAYPIRTYPHFEDSLSQSFKDPLGPMLENMSKLGPDEQLWFQILVTNTDIKWIHKSERLVKKLIGAKGGEEKSTFLQMLANFPFAFFGFFGDLISTGPTEKKQNEIPSLMQHISPGEREAVEQIELKMGKVGFYTRVRFVYLAKKHAYNGSRTDEMFGAIKQFNTLDLNALKPSPLSATKVYGFFKKYRKNKRKRRILRLYRLRGTTYTPGYYGYIMNSEELATLYHFPVTTSVKAPLIKKSEAKRAEPPISLPVIK